MSRNSAALCLHSSSCWSLWLFWHASLQYFTRSQLSQSFNLMSSIAVMPQLAQHVSSTVAASSDLIFTNYRIIVIYEYSRQHTIILPLPQQQEDTIDRPQQTNNREGCVEPNAGAKIADNSYVEMVIEAWHECDAVIECPPPINDAHHQGEGTHNFAIINTTLILFAHCLTTSVFVHATKPELFSAQAKQFYMYSHCAFAREYSVQTARVQNGESAKGVFSHCVGTRRVPT